MAGELVALSEEYAIEIVPDEKPVIEIRRPGRDWRATSIEEVPVRIQAEDDFRLRDVSLRYSVNGGEWQSVPVGGGAKRSEGRSLLDLEQLGASQPQSADSLPRLVPGDLVSYYAVAKDRKSTVQTDLFMVQVQPFERKFRQAQGGGGGGGMADEQGAISERQREILLATWNLQRNDERNARSRQQLEDNATMLAELQTTLSQQARTLATRTRARASVEEDENIKAFVESLEKAASVMDPAADRLDAFRLQEAVPFEQQALQHLLRAEAAFREVQVSMERNDANGDGSQRARNFTEMFELEMDLEKNQYESESQVSMHNQQKDLDEAIRKLKELAERQERLAQERNRQGARLDEQRWKQEQLRRDAEDLRRRLAELNRQQQRSDPNGQPRRSDSDSQSGQQANDGSSGSEQRNRLQRDRNQHQRERLARALESVNQALQDMQAANGAARQNPNQADQSARSAQDAGKSLRRALQQIDQREPSNFDETLEQFAGRSQELFEAQRRIESDLYEALSQGGASQQRLNSRGGIDPRRAQQLVRTKQQMTNDLTELQSDMRNSVHENREAAPRSTKRLSEIIRDIEGSDVMYRLNRSAAEIYYGRAREAAAREGLITDALDTMERDLREAAALARSEKQNKGQPDQRTSEQLLAEVAELRRALQAAGRSGDDGERHNQQATTQQQEGQRNGQGRQDGNRSSNESARGGESNAGLAAWNPGARETPHGRFADDTDSLARQTAATSQRIRDLAFRIRRGELGQAELEALRQAANQLRRLSGDPLTGDPDVMMKLIDQIELSALNATRRSDDASARAVTPSAESARYREVVAEYYRRLGNQ